MRRRQFIRTMAVGAVATHLSGCGDLDVLQPTPRASVGDSPFRATGRILDGDIGIGGVAVSDGRAVVSTDADGYFELVAETRPDFVSVSIPGGYRIPANQYGLTQHFRRVLPGVRDVSLRFDLTRSEFTQARHRTLLLGDVQVSGEADVKHFRDLTISEVEGVLAAESDLERVVVSMGDMIDETPHLMAGYLGGLEQLGVPVSHVIGNHDRRPGGSIETIKDYFTGILGPRYYSYNVGATHFVVLDNVRFHESGSDGAMDAQQLAWLHADLATVEPGSTVLMFAHFPFSTMSLEQRQLLEAVAEVHRVHLFTGHQHLLRHTTGAHFSDHVVGAVCGAWWQGPICTDGTPNGYMLVDVAGDEVSWRYKAEGLPWHQQMTAYVPCAPCFGGSDRSRVVVNVWDWDPSWTVRWFEDGEPRGAMFPQRGKDPLSLELYGGALVPVARPAVEPDATDHLFAIQPSAVWRAITVVAVDGTGRRYEQVVRRGA